MVRSSRHPAAPKMPGGPETRLLYKQDTQHGFTISKMGADQGWAGRFI